MNDFLNCYENVGYNCNDAIDKSKMDEFKSWVKENQEKFTVELKAIQTRLDDLEKSIENESDSNKKELLQSQYDSLYDSLYSEFDAKLDRFDEEYKARLDVLLKEVYNLSYKKDPVHKNAILQNAYGVEETQELNQLYYMTFNIPGDDNKMKYIQPFGYVRWNEDGQLYRIIKRSVDQSDTENVRVECEHVIATLCNDVMYGTHTYGGGTVKTSDVINYVLSYQKVHNWILGGCDFDRRFEYTWKHETLLNALFNIPKEFNEDYMWDYDTTVYPWRLYLRKLDKDIHPEFYIRAKRNLIGSTADSDYTGIFTRVYPLGYEDQDGVQLTIESVNEGIPFVQASKEYIEKYGIIETVLIDRRFENAESLKAYGEAVLENSLEPGISRTFDVVDLYPLTSTAIDNAKVGALARLTGDGTNVFITKTTRVLDQPGNLNVELSTKSTTIGKTMADIANTVQINSVYS